VIHVTCVDSLWMKLTWNQCMDVLHLA
jgi:hypothetical protein